MDCNHPLDLPPDLEAIRQEHEAFLTKLEALAVQRSHHRTGHQLSISSTFRHLKLMTYDLHNDDRGSGR
jgi:hypothetical protein